MHALRTVLGWLGLALASVCAFASLAAHGGRFTPVLDVLTQFAPLYLAGAMFSALMAAAAVGASRRLGLVMAAAGALAAAALMAPEFFRDAGPTAAPGAPGEIKVIQFNAWRQNRELDRIVAWLEAEKPDVAILEEVTPALRNLIIKRTGWKVAGSNSSDMIFTRAPYLIMNRPEVPSGSPLGWVNATYDNPSGPMEVVVTHFGWPTQPTHSHQSVALREVLARLPHDRMILAGDFNSTPWSFARRRDDRGFGLIRRDRALATWPTGHAGPWLWPAPFPFMPIDHVYAGPGWATTSVRRGPRLGSDHYPVVVTLAPAAPR